MRARFAVAASIAAAALLGVELFAQATATAQPPTTSSAPPMTSVLAGKKLVPPIRGEAALEWVEPKPEKNAKGDMVITKMTVRNASAGPIARLTINETWYDKAGGQVTAGRGVIQGLLLPGETAVVTIETPWKAGMQGFQRQYAHANGTIKPVKVNKLEAPKPTTDSATTTGKPATTTAKPTTTAPADTTKKP